MPPMVGAKQVAIAWMKKYLRYVDYIGAACLYLQSNFLLTEGLRPSHIKRRILGHWGTVPGLNLIYANLNYLISKHNCEILLVTGPGHGAPSILANLFAEGTLNAFYKGEYPINEKGMGKLIHDFSWPHSHFPSHITPSVPGSILEGGELGYCLATAYGAALDNPNLIVAAIVGDGESETGPTATAWHSNKFLNPKTSGAVLPIIHINRYKISNPTLYGTMSDAELKSLFTGYGYEPIIAEGSHMEDVMIAACEKAYQKIRTIQREARRHHASKVPLKPAWPVILLRSPKGWKGIREFEGKPIEYSFHSHGVPIDHPDKNPAALTAVEKWLKSYKVNELIDAKGRPLAEITKFIPKNKRAIGMCRHALGGNIRKPLKINNISKYAVAVKKRGTNQASSMIQGGQCIRDIFKKNKTNFRLVCPDEVESNQLHEVFNATKRAYLWPTSENDEHLSPDGRVMEMLSEHTLQGWLQGYLLTGRHGIFVTYEAFATIISSMVDQHAKFLKQSIKIPWRKPISNAIYILSSLGWRQDHNGFSHQNPSFVSNVLEKHGEFCQIYYPPDANSFLVALEEALIRTDTINVIVAGKRNLPQWLSLKEAREQARHGVGIWEWATSREAVRNPDVVLASAGDYMTQEALFGIKLCKAMVPELKIRYVNVSELTAMHLGGHCERPICYTENDLEAYFTKDRPVVFNYHGYVNDIEQILWPYASSARFVLHGYKESGSTTTPFDMKIRNGVSCYHVAMNLIKQGAKYNKSVARKRDKLLTALNEKICAHHDYICEYGDDPEEVKNTQW